MPQNRSRFVLLCQQSLAFGLVAVIAAPAANVVTLDIVSPHRDDVAGAATPAAPGTPAVAGGAGSTPSAVAAAPVKPRVVDVPLSGISASGVRALDEAPTTGRTGARLVAADGDPELDDLAALSAPQPVERLATVGVTWEPGAVPDDDAITVSVRTETDGAWSGWQTMPYHDEHGPDAASTEGRTARPGTDPVYVGTVDDVQVKAVTDTGEAPDGMRLSLVDPGAQTDTAQEQPDIDTGELELSAADTDASLAAASVTAKPQIYSRAQWGADERMRDSTSLHYGEVHAGFVHHTVNANTYTQDQVPAIIRGIYAYHTQSKGWSDVGYNFLVDRFGRIWEGRYGGVDRPVVGAHTLGYNDDAFAMSAIGNFETVQPPAAMLDAYGRLFAWKLSLHGVSASSTRQFVTKQYLPAINGHRDVGQTACPGRYLYAKIPAIRSLAEQYQKSFTPRTRTADVGGTRWPDLVVRDKETQRGYVVRTGGQVGYSAAKVVGSGWTGLDKIVAVGDVTGDGRSDLLARTRSTGSTSVRPGTTTGGFGAPTRTSTMFAYADMVTGVGDWNADGRNDVAARSPRTHRLYLHLGDGRGSFARARLLSASWGGYTSTVGTGDVTGDRRPDLAAIGTDGRLVIARGTGSGLATPTAVRSGWDDYTLVGGLQDLTNDGLRDLVVRDATKAAWIYPGTGTGSVGTRLGAFPQLTATNVLVAAGQVSGSGAADLVGRDSAGRLVVFTNNGRSNVESVTATGQSFRGADLLVSAGDWNGDGYGDVVSRTTGTGLLSLYAGTATGRLSAPVRMSGTSFASVRLLAAVGDVTGDGYPDLMGQPSGSSMRIYPSNGRNGFRASYVAHAAVPGSQQLGIGLWNGDGAPDSLLRAADGTLTVWSGNGPGGLTGAATAAGSLPGYAWLLAQGDLNGDRRPDLVARGGAGRLWLFPGASSGFGERRSMADGMSRFDLAG